MVIVMAFKDILEKLPGSNYGKLIKYLKNNIDIDLTNFNYDSWDKIKKYIRKDVKSIKLKYSDDVKSNLDFFKFLPNLEKIDLGENSSLDEKTLEFFCTLGLKELIVGDLNINYENGGIDFLSIASSQGIHVYYNGMVVNVLHGNTIINTNNLIIEGKLNEEVASRLLSKIDVSHLEKVKINHSFKQFNSYLIEMQGLVIENFNVEGFDANELFKVYSVLVGKGYKFEKINISLNNLSLNDALFLIQLFNTESLRDANVKLDLFGEEMHIKTNLVNGKLSLSVKLSDMSKVKQLYDVIMKNQIPLGEVSINISEYSNKYDEDFDMEFLRRISEICDLKIDYCDNEIFSSNYEEWKGLRDSIKWYRKLITSYNLSPVEKVMYAYDLMKSIPYRDANKIGFQGRAPHSVMSTEYAVCMGYVATFMEIMNDLSPSIGTTSNMFYKRNHASVMVRIDDDKYNIHGIFELDMTADNVIDSAVKDTYNFDTLNSLDLYYAFLVPVSEHIKIYNNGELPAYLNTFAALQSPRYNSYLTDKAMHDLRKRYQDLFGEPLNGTKMTTYINAKKPSLADFRSMLLNVRKAQGFSHEEAVKEVDRVVKLNLDYSRYINELGKRSKESEVTFFEDNVRRNV